MRRFAALLLILNLMIPSVAFSADQAAARRLRAAVPARPSANGKRSFARSPIPPI